MKKVALLLLQTFLTSSMFAQNYTETESYAVDEYIEKCTDILLALAKTITTIQIKLPLNKDVYTQTMLMARHQKIAELID